MSYGLWEVTENHTYRGKAAGTIFEARMDRGAERRGMDRGVLRFLGPVTPELQPDSYTFPQGWLSGPHQSTEAPEGAFFMDRKE